MLKVKRKKVIIPHMLKYECFYFEENFQINNLCIHPFKASVSSHTVCSKPQLNQGKKSEYFNGHGIRTTAVIGILLL